MFNGSVIDIFFKKESLLAVTHFTIEGKVLLLKIVYVRLSLFVIYSFEKGVSFLQSLFLLNLFMINSVLQKIQTMGHGKRYIPWIFFIRNNCAKSVLINWI